MAMRIRESVLRGEIDNRVKGRVRGKIWVAGLDEPLELDLKGNAAADLAGCLLTFVNPVKPEWELSRSALSLDQRGVIGDLTASRRVRVCDLPFKEALDLVNRKETLPEDWINCLYLEWFSHANGRVVIETPCYELTLSAPEWRMTPEEEAERAAMAAAGMADFLRKFNEAIELHREGAKDPGEPWDEHDYERLLRESDARTEKYKELLEKYGDSEEGREKINQEMGWANQRADGEERFSEDEINDCLLDEALEALPEPDPLLEGIDWIRTEHGEIRHPVQHRCLESLSRISRRATELMLEESEDEDLDLFLSEFQMTNVKLAGALGGIAQGWAGRDDSFTVAYLKRALGHLHKSQGGLEALIGRRVLPMDFALEIRRELFAIREEILALMDRFRGRV